MDPEHQFFGDNEAPSTLAQVEKQTLEFADFHFQHNRKIVLVTSGGTNVPLEKNTVRFVTNFSTGGRGANSTECFIRRGYAVIFLYKQGSVEPYERHFTGQPQQPLLDLIETTESGELQFKPNEDLKTAFKEYQQAKANNMLLKVSYTTLFEYLFFLRSITTVVRHQSKYREQPKRFMVFLAAAVSDYYIPFKEMSEHKIQSGDVSKLQISFENTPKMLKLLTSEWCPQAFNVSFKLETDPDMLYTKATGV
eukprot:GEZU01027797.1.p1 GENE.GEZU01027797.1~~GEZU01027797.1.p1  ORF type:complete len:251 (+),score=53.68 GEZU01027797.1:49-801(+)